MSDKFIETQKLDNGGTVGIMLNEYKGAFSLAAAYCPPDGEAKMRWCFPQVGRDKASDKAVPVKLTLGDRAKACEILIGLINEIDPNFSIPPVGAKMSDYPGPDDDLGIPF